MNSKLVSASFAAVLVLGAGSLTANSAPIGAGLTALQSNGALIQKARYDDDDRRGWSWRHHRFDNEHRDGGGSWSWRYHRVDRDDRHHGSRDRYDRSDRDDHRWR